MLRGSFDEDRVINWLEATWTVGIEFLVVHQAAFAEVGRALLSILATLNHMHRRVSTYSTCQVFLQLVIKTFSFVFFILRVSISFSAIKEDSFPTEQKTLRMTVFAAERISVVLVKVKTKAVL